MKWKTLLGFTLLELLIFLGLIGVIAVFTIPDFIQMSTAVQMKRTARELQGFLIQSRSEAIARNQDLWAHITNNQTRNLDVSWLITLTDSAMAGSGETIRVIDGRSFPSIALNWNYTLDRIKFDGVRGRIKNGSLHFYVIGESDKTLRLKSSFFANRVVVCAEGVARYGYSTCQ